MKNTTNVFLHTFGDFDYFINHLVEENNLYTLYVTHAGVKEYINKNSKFKSTLLSELASQKEIDKIQLSAENLSNVICNNLDQKYSSQLSKQFNITNINYFSPLYSYHFPFILTGLFFFRENLLKLDNNNAAIIFDYTDTFLNHFTLKDFIQHFPECNNINIKWYKSCTSRKSTNNSPLEKIKKISSRIIYEIKNYLYEYYSYKSKKRKTILYMENLYDLNFIRKSNKFRLIPYKYQSLTHKFCLSKKRSEKPDIGTSLFNDHNSGENNLEYHLSHHLIKHFLKYCNNYQFGLQQLNKLLVNNKINLAIWGNPPVDGFKSLFYEYCRSTNIKVVGMQHGSGWVYQTNNNNYTSEFSRCDHYISYGFTQDDYNKYFNSNSPLIHPLGTTKKLKIETKQNNKKIDVLFPVSNSISIFDGGFCRISPDQLHKDQMDILNFLEQKNQQNVASLIKPFFQTNLWQTSTFLKIKALKNVQIEWNKNLKKLLEYIQPKCVIIELFSTPLYEIINYDVDIFLFVRESETLTIKARTMLEKRVYIVKDFNEFEELFLKWKKNQLPRKREKSYLNYYISKKESKAHILELLKKI